jgi:hypothetical protein
MGKLLPFSIQGADAAAVPGAWARQQYTTQSAAYSVLHIHKQQQQHLQLTSNKALVITPVVLIA